MKLVVHELKAAGVVQAMNSTENKFIVAIRPHIYRHNFPTGGLKVQVLTDLDVLITESETINIADIGTQDFFHGYVRFLVSIGMTKDVVYKFKLVGTGGYTFNESSYVGWCNDFDLAKYATGYTPPSLIERPLDLELWERKQI